MRVGDALDWLHEQGKQRARTVPEFDLEATLRVLRAVRDADAYALSYSKAIIALQEALSDAQADAAVQELLSEAEAPIDEAQLVAQIAARNDDEAARRLYREYRMELFRFGVHVLHDQGLAEEMVQETFIKFCQQAGSYDANRGPVRAWLFMIARSVAYDIARRPSSRPFLPIDDIQLLPPPDSTDQILDSLILREAIDKLPAIYADVMRLLLEGFTHSEIAERLGIPIGTVKSRMAKTAVTLRAELTGLRGDDDAF